MGHRKNLQNQFIYNGYLCCFRLRLQILYCKHAFKHFLSHKGVQTDAIIILNNET
ncbi:MAG: hypothetical protein JWP37_1158 [Mucilaginibacter sp.]|nr:hypothetical protein [Mucilaginibacter sp.]